MSVKDHNGKCAVWKYFKDDTADKTKAICNACKFVLSRGKTLHDCGTSTMCRHLQRHKKLYQELLSAEEAATASGLRTRNRC